MEREPKCNVVGMIDDEKMHDSIRRVYSTDGLAPTQNANGGGNLETKIVLNTTTEGLATTLTGAHHYSGNIINPKRGQKEMGVQEGYRIRKLTERECFRLMDVSEADIDKIQAAGISKTQQYKMAGNSIVVSCLYHIFDRLFIHTDHTELTLF